MGDHGYVATTRGRQTVRDMVLSMAVIGLIAGFIYLFVPHDPSQDPVQPVSYEVEVATARRAAPYPVAAPEGLPDTWRATSVWYREDSEHGAAWHLGFVGPGQEYAAVEQSDGEAAPFVDSVTHGARSTGETQRINGATWTRYRGPKYDALVRTEPGVTTVVTGTAPFRELVELAEALKAERG